MVSFHTVQRKAPGEKPAKGEGYHGKFAASDQIDQDIRKAGGRHQGPGWGKSVPGGGGVCGHYGRLRLWENNAVELCITIDRPTSGSILVEGKELTKLRGRELTRFRRERLGFIFQDCNLLDTLTAFENIALALSIVGTPAQEIRPRAEETARLLGIEDCLEKYPYQMSGGQQQRCAAARAIVTHPALVLADEPTGALDSKSAKLLLERLEVLNRERGTTILIVTHDAFTASCCQRVVFLRDGQIFQELIRGAQDRRSFFAQIIRVITQLGGEMEDVL